MDGRMFDGMFEAILIIGVICGVLLVSIIWAFFTWGWPLIKPYIHQWTS
jgi:hypothetical protein